MNLITQPMALFAMAVVLLSGCASAPQTVPAPPAQLPKQLRDRQIIVTLAQAGQSQWDSVTQAVARDYALQTTGTFPLNSISVWCIVYRVPDDRPLDVMLAQLASDPRIEAVQINQVFEGLRADVKPGRADPYAAQQYATVAMHTEFTHRWSTGKGVRVAVVDTGANQEHPDLRGRIVQTANFVENGELSFAQDRHGTAIAGVIGARADNGIGIFGVAPDAELMVLKACWYTNPQNTKALCSSWTLAKAVDFAINNQAQVINLSLAGPPDKLLRRLIDTAVTKNVTVVAAVAEADAAEPGFPASLDSVIAVMASDSHAQVVTPRWRKERTLIAAPGMEIITTAPPEGYDFLSGSSLAAAQVSGVVALLKEKHPELSPAQIAEILQTTSLPVAGAAESVAFTVGQINACAALAKLSDTRVCP